MGTSCRDLTTVKSKKSCPEIYIRRSRKELKVLGQSSRADATQFTRTPGETSVALMLVMIVDFCTENPYGVIASVPRYF